MHSPAPLPAITALILCGGQGSRMGGVDKGLQPLHGQPLVWHVLQRLRGQSLPPATIHLSANRHLDMYAALGLPVWPDEALDAGPPPAAGAPGSGLSGANAVAGFAGPLAGVLAGLRHCATPLLLTLPCDVPCFPASLCERLAQALQAQRHTQRHAQAPGQALAMAATRDETGQLRTQPLFSLLRRDLLPDLHAYLQAGGRKAGEWMARHAGPPVVFDTSASGPCFANANTLQDLQTLAGQLPPLAG